MSAYYYSTGHHRRVVRLQFHEIVDLHNESSTRLTFYNLFTDYTSKGCKLYDHEVRGRVKSRGRLAFVTVIGVSVIVGFSK